MSLTPTSNLKNELPFEVSEYPSRVPSFECAKDRIRNSCVWVRTLSEVFHNPSEIFQSVLVAVTSDTDAVAVTSDTVAFDDTVDLSDDDAAVTSDTADLETKQFIYRPLSRPEITLERFWDFKISRRAEELMEQMLKDGTVWIEGSEGGEGPKVDSTLDTMNNNNSTLDMANNNSKQSLKEAQSGTKKISSKRSSQQKRASSTRSSQQKAKNNVLRQDEVLVCPKKTGIELLVYCF